MEENARAAAGDPLIPSLLILPYAQPFRPSPPHTDPSRGAGLSDDPSPSGGSSPSRGASLREGATDEHAPLAQGAVPASAVAPRGLRWRGASVEVRPRYGAPGCDPSVPETALKAVRPRYGALGCDPSGPETALKTVSPRHGALGCDPSVPETAGVRPPAREQAHSSA